MDKMTDEEIVKIGCSIEDAHGYVGVEGWTGSTMIAFARELLSRVQPIDPRVIEEAIAVLEFYAEPHGFICDGKWLEVHESNMHHTSTRIFGSRAKDMLAKLKSARQPKEGE